MCVGIRFWIVLVVFDFVFNVLFMMIFCWLCFDVMFEGLFGCICFGFVNVGKLCLFVFDCVLKLG